MANIDVNNILSDEINSKKEPETTKDLGAKADEKSNIDGTGKSEEAGKQVKQIVIDGPLSEIYTQALNIAYAKKPLDENGEARTPATETQATEVVALAAATMAKNRENDIACREMTYLFTTSSGELDKNGVSDALDTLIDARTNPDYSEVVLAIESHSSFGKNAGLLCNAVEAAGVKILYSRISAMNYFRNR